MIIDSVYADVDRNIHYCRPSRTLCLWCLGVYLSIFVNCYTRLVLFLAYFHHDVIIIVIFYRTLGRSCSIPNLISVCTLAQSNGGTSCGFRNIKSKWNMFISDCKCSPVHKYLLNQSKMNMFHVNNGRGALCLSQGRRMGSPAWTRRRAWKQNRIGVI